LVYYGGISPGIEHIEAIDAIETIDRAKPAELQSSFNEPKAPLNLLTDL
jgi:hypothetical protein